MAADGSNALQLTDDPANDQEPSWSPDGAEHRVRQWTGALPMPPGQLWVMTADGQAQRRCCRPSDGAAMSSPAWSRR